MLLHPYVARLVQVRHQPPYVLVQPHLLQVPAHLARLVLLFCLVGGGEGPLQPCPAGLLVTLVPSTEKQTHTELVRVETGGSQVQGRTAGLWQVPSMHPAGGIQLQEV